MGKENFIMSKEQSITLKLSLIKQGLNDGQISDVFGRIKTEKDYNEYLK